MPKIVCTWVVELKGEDSNGERIYSATICNGGHTPFMAWWTITKHLIDPRNYKLRPMQMFNKACKKLRKQGLPIIKPLKQTIIHPYGHACINRETV